MLEELRATLSFLKALYGFVTQIGQRAAEEGQRFDEAVEAVFLACARTRSYIAAFERSLQEMTGAKALPVRASERLIARAQAHRDLACEAELSALWREAARKIRKYDRELADRLNVKSYCWADPRLFTTQKYGGIRINIDDIFDTTRRLIRQRGDPGAILSRDA